MAELSHGAKPNSDRPLTVAVAGGRLQGVEACLLARRAGYRVHIVDRAAGRPAERLADAVTIADVASDAALAVYREADLILPATENLDTLERLTALCRRHGLPLAFDLDAYRVTMSKSASDRLIHAAGVPAPRHWPCAAPCIGKPSEGSGSHGVVRLDTEEAARRYSLEHPDAIVEEYLEGRGYSIEVIGRPNEYRTYQVTEIHVDADYDCCLVTCPVDLPAAVKTAFAADSVRLAEALGLVGIMDVEAIYHGGELKVLEIDARLPSQTPTAVERSTGVNFLVELMALFTAKAEFAPPIVGETPTAYEHFTLTDGEPVSLGEGVLSGEKPLVYCEGRFGADAALLGAKSGIFISTAADRAALDKKRRAVKTALKEEAW